MAKMKYLSASGVLEEIADYYNNGEGGFTSEGKQTAVWTIDGSGNTMTFKGTNMRFEQGVLVSGTVNKVLFEDFEGADFAVMKGEFKAATLGKALETQSPEHFIEVLSKGNDVMVGTDRADYMEGHKGNDIIKGGSGDDLLWAGRGKDQLVGGSGSDTFFFETKNTDVGYPGDGNDTITDFKDGLDFIGTPYDYVTDIHKDGKNTVIEFEGGGSFTLLNVKVGAITEADFAYVA